MIMKKFLVMFLTMTCIPYVTTLAWSGRIADGNIAGIDLSREEDEKTVIVVRNEKESRISAEEFLIHVLAAQIPADFEQETLKAQAVLARTYIYSEMEAAGELSEIYEEALDMDALSREEMEKNWGSSDFTEKYGKLKTAVEETEGMCLWYGDSYAEPLFCYASSGRTRSGGEMYPYLRETESKDDLLADGYLSLPVFSAEELAKKISAIPDAVPVSASDLPAEIQIVERDSAGYVKQVKIGEKTYTGEEVQYALGLASPCFSFEEYDGKIRVICKGVGHGYGFSQFGANELAKGGMDFSELLGYYFHDTEVRKNPQ